MNSVPRDAANSVPLVFLAVGSSLMLGALIGAGYCAAQAWRMDADAVVWLAASVGFLLVAATVTPMMIGLGYGSAEIQRLLHFYTSPVRVMHKRRNRPIILSGRSATVDDEDDARAA